MAEEGMQSPLARKLRMLRAAEGITLAEVEERSGVTRESIGELERGKRIPFCSTLHKLARAYGVSLAELFEEEPTPKVQAPRASGQTRKAAEPRLAPGQLIDPSVYRRCRARVDKLCDKWEPVLQASWSRERAGKHVDMEVFEGLEEDVDLLTPYIDVATAAEMAEIGQPYDEEGEPIFWSERSELFPALERLYNISLGLRRLAKKQGEKEPAPTAEIIKIFETRLAA
jgi:transcriptional regulator with XRE-family HTH domain